MIVEFARRNQRLGEVKKGLDSFGMKIRGTRIEGSCVSYSDAWKEMGGGEGGGAGEKPPANLLGCDGQALW